jgi:hypothetical protein
MQMSFNELEVRYSLQYWKTIKTLFQSLINDITDYITLYWLSNNVCSVRNWTFLWLFMKVYQLTYLAENNNKNKTRPSVVWTICFRWIAWNRNVTSRTSKRNYARLPLGSGDRLRLLSKLRIIGSIKTLVNFHKCFIKKWQTWSVNAARCYLLSWAIILISWNVIFIWETGYWTRAIKRFALFDLLKSLYSDTKILSQYIPSLQKRL